MNRMFIENRAALGAIGSLHTPGLRIMSWNVAGAKYLMEPRGVRTVYQATLNRALADLARRFKPHFIALQEIVRFSSANGIEDLIQPPAGYHYQPSIAIDTRNHTHPRKWEKFRAIGGWQPRDYLGQGSGLLWQKNIAHASLWNTDPPRTGAHISTEDVHIDTGLYTGDRDTEPRLVPVAHFVMPLTRGQSAAGQESAIDILLANLHLTTLRGEREGAGVRDEEGSATRRAQLDIVFHGIVSRYNRWRRRVSQRGRPPVWFIAGDFNCTPGSREVAHILANRFIDITPCKGKGTKGHSIHQVSASMAVDYIFAGPDPHSLERVFALQQLAALEPIRTPVSDHLALVAHLPLHQGLNWACA